MQKLNQAEASTEPKPEGKADAKADGDAKPRQMPSLSMKPCGAQARSQSGAENRYQSQDPAD